MSALEPSPHEIEWYDFVKQKGDEAEALYEWFGQFVEDFSLEAQRAGWGSTAVTERVSNLHQVLESFAYAWGFPPPRA